MDRVLEQVRIRLAPKRPEVTVVLDPPELGRLHLRLALRGGALSATVTVDDIRVAKAFEADVGHLVRTLDEAGIRVSEVEIRSGLTDDSSQRGTTHRGEDGHDRNQSETTRKQSKETHSRDDDKPDASQRNVVNGRSTTLDVVV